MCLFDHILDSSTDETKIGVIRAKEFVHHGVRCIEKLFWASKETRRVLFHYLGHQSESAISLVGCMKTYDHLKAAKR